MSVYYVRGFEEKTQVKLKLQTFKVWRHFLAHLFYIYVCIYIYIYIYIFVTIAISLLLIS